MRELAAAAEAGAAIHTNSWHRSPQGEGLPATYDLLSAATDRFCWENEDHLVVGSSGNTDEEQGPPGTSKNAVCVSACDGHPAGDVFGDGSPGPTADGRMKPDVVTVGCGIVSARRGTACGLTAPQSCASSWATPELAAGAALLRQYLREGRHPSGSPRADDARRPSGALLKALLVASTPLPEHERHPDPRWGWGVAQLDRVLGHPLGPRQTFLHDVRHHDGLREGETSTSSVVLTGDDQPLEVTLVWTDPPALEGAGLALVDELDLEVSHEERTGAGIPSFDDGTVKRALVPHPGAGRRDVTIRATVIRRDERRQGFALVVTGPLRR